jgi:photosynthetic reaction center cytochrome c subunit
MTARILVASLLAVALLSACERPPVQSTQQGYRGTGMVQIDNPRIDAAQRLSERQGARRSVGG